MEPIGPDGQPIEPKGKRSGCLPTWGAIIGIVLFVGTCAMISMPGFMVNQKRMKTSEARANLAGAATAEIAYLADNSRYGKSFAEIGWEPTGQYKYHYALGDAHFPPNNGPDSGETCGDGVFPEKSGVSDTGFTIHASANIDGDPYIDGWQINNNKELINVCNDVSN